MNQTYLTHGDQQPLIMATGFTHTVFLKITLVVCKTSQQNTFVTAVLLDSMSFLNSLHTCMGNKSYQPQSLVTDLSKDYTQL